MSHHVRKGLQRDHSEAIHLVIVGMFRLFYTFAYFPARSGQDCKKSMEPNLNGPN